MKVNEFKVGLTPSWEVMNRILEFHFFEGRDEFTKLVLLEWTEVESNAGGELSLVVERGDCDALKGVRDFLKSELSFLEPESHWDFNLCLRVAQKNFLLFAVLAIFRHKLHNLIDIFHEGNYIAIWANIFLEQFLWRDTKLIDHWNPHIIISNIDHWLLCQHYLQFVLLFILIDLTTGDLVHIVELNCRRECSSCVSKGSELDWVELVTCFEWKHLGLLTVWLFCKCTQLRHEDYTQFQLPVLHPLVKLLYQGVISIMARLIIGIAIVLWFRIVLWFGIVHRLSSLIRRLIVEVSIIAWWWSLVVVVVWRVSCWWDVRLGGMWDWLCACYFWHLSV